jgi:hypothetical protein
MRNRSQSGVALVTTLIMLAVVTLMAVAFLAVSRRERGSVIVSRDQTDSRAMADMALERAKAETAARMLATSNLLAYDLMVSTNYINPLGFQPGVADPTNVSYVSKAGVPLDGIPLLQNLANLQFSPRPPVFVQTNRAGSNDFRFYLDFNRNRLFDSNGLLRVWARGQPTTETNFFVGDPEWIGVLERPDRPHSRSNLFIGRYAYLVQPVGKTLDLNFIHNHAKPTSAQPGNFVDGYLRNQGVGSWELNLAAFLRDLNTNAWPSYLYDATPTGPPSSGMAFDHATALLRYRYEGNSQNLRPATALFGSIVANRAFTVDGIDRYSDGPLMTGINPPLPSPDAPAYPWSGSFTTNRYFDILDLFTQAASSPGVGSFLTRLQNAASTALDYYDRYTFYRMLAQIGTESTRADTNKVNLNYDNSVTNGTQIALLSATNFVEWKATNFFHTAAEQLLRSKYTFGVRRIPIYPTNHYTPEVHRLLQLAANIYDTTTNRIVVGLNNRQVCLPTVFRPVFSRAETADSTNVWITGYVEVSNNDPFYDALPWVDLSIPTDRARITTNTHVNVYGVPVIIGAKKGFPNFNEMALKTTLMVTRKLEVVRSQAGAYGKPVQTNQVYLIGISNLFGLEAWNSYTQAFPRALTLQVKSRSSVVITNQVPPITTLLSKTIAINHTTNLPAGTWLGQGFQLPVYTNEILLTNSAYYSTPSPHFERVSRTTRFESIYTVPRLGMAITNRLQYWLIDRDTGRLLDFVNLDQVNTQMDITQALVGGPGGSGDLQEGRFWDITLEKGVPAGVAEQIRVSLGLNQNVDWADYNSAVADKQKSIDYFRLCLGLPGQVYSNFVQLAPVPLPGRSVETPFNPTRKLVQSTYLQANDPLVHYTIPDLVDLNGGVTTLEVGKPLANAFTNHNLGQVNKRSRPWGGNPRESNDPNRYNLAIKDPMITRSDDWNFPTNPISKFANIGWLGRVHRGTPWQTVYLKAPVEPLQSWEIWAGATDTHPTNDWRLMDLFTTAPFETAARGLLSVNQTNLAAWSAVLSGVPVLTNPPTKGRAQPSYLSDFISPSSWQLSEIVTGTNGINATRALQPNHVFAKLGDILATPALTVASPFINSHLYDKNIDPASGPSDEVYERIPQMILSLLKADEPRVVIYAFGQSLAPAPRSRVVQAGPFFQMVTNYTVTGEVATKSIVRFEGPPSSPRAVTESFTILPSD